VLYKVFSACLEQRIKEIHTITIAIPSAVSCSEEKGVIHQLAQKNRRKEKKPLTNISPQFPVLNTHPLPLAMIHALSSPFGNTYIASSPRRLFASTNNERPDMNPKNQKDPFEMSISTSDCGKALTRAYVKGEDEEECSRRRVRYLCRLCL
jgi:hypothetical protein